MRIRKRSILQFLHHAAPPPRSSDHFFVGSRSSPAEGLGTRGDGGEHLEEQADEKQHETYQQIESGHCVLCPHQCAATCNTRIPERISTECGEEEMESDSVVLCPATGHIQSAIGRQGGEISCGHESPKTMCCKERKKTEKMKRAAASSYAPKHISISDANRSRLGERSRITEGSRCSRINGRGWRCSQPTLVGYSLCEHHLGKGRLRSMSSLHDAGHDGDNAVSCCTGGANETSTMTGTRKKMGGGKARSISDLV